MPIYARAYGRTLKSSPSSPLPPSVRTKAGKPDTEGEGGEHGEGLQLYIHVRAPHARVKPPHPPHAPRRAGWRRAWLRGEDANDASHR